MFGANVWEQHRRVCLGVAEVAEWDWRRKRWRPAFVETVFLLR